MKLVKNLLLASALMLSVSAHAEKIAVAARLI